MDNAATPSDEPDEPPHQPDQQPDQQPDGDPGWQEPGTGPGITGPRGVGSGAATLPSSTGSGPLKVAARTGERNKRKVREGVVVSDKMDKTVVVEVEEEIALQRVKI